MEASTIISTNAEPQRLRDFVAAHFMGILGSKALVHKAITLGCVSVEDKVVRAPAFFVKGEKVGASPY
jgi:hypothetical protein